MTARFVTDLYFLDLNRRAEPSTKRIQLKLMLPLIFDSAVLNRRITVPTGFVTDLASVPRFLWAIVPPLGKYDDAAVVHDWLYQSGGLERREADAVLREAMDACGVSHGERNLIYDGVRIGGWLAWRRYRKAGAVELVARHG